MDLGECNNTDQAVTALLRLKSFRPFQYTGRWFISSIQGKGVAYRNKNDLMKRACRELPAGTPLEVSELNP